MASTHSVTDGLTEPVSVDDGGGSLTVDGPLTDAELRATPVPVSGTVTAAEARAEDSAHASGHSGIPVWGVRNDASAALTDADLDYSPLAVDSAGRMKVAVEVGGGGGPSISGGLSIYKNLDVNNVGQVIKGSAGQVYSIILHNLSAGTRYLKLYNKATAPIVGTDIPVMTIPVDKLGSGGLSVQIDVSAGAAFSLGIGIGATTGIADSNTANPGANDVVATILFK